MLNRCYNPNYRDFKNYGGRGITVCDRWKNFANFYADMGDQQTGQTIERTDNNGIYAPDNCVWASRLQQNRNKRTVRHITFRGETKILAYIV